MILRAPSVPLVTVDPFFSVWSDANKLNDKDTVHWTGKPFTLCGSVTIDGESYTFMGGSGNKLEQVDLEITALTSVYTFEGAGVRLTATFFTPLFPDDPAIMTRPVSYLKLDAVSLDGIKHFLKAIITDTDIR